MTSLFKPVSRGNLGRVIMIICTIISSTQAHSQQPQCDPASCDRDWAQISSYIDDEFDLIEFCNQADTAATKQVEKSQPANEDIDRYDTQDNQASRSLDRRKTNSLEESKSQLEDDDIENEPVDWRWEGKDKL